MTLLDRRDRDYLGQLPAEERLLHRKAWDRYATAEVNRSRNETAQTVEYAKWAYEQACMMDRKLYKLIVTLREADERKHQREQAKALSGKGKGKAAA
jgi:hypothetical protein